MKILIVGPGLMEIPPKGWGAVEILVWDQYLALKKLGHSVFILNTRSRKEILDKIESLKPNFTHFQHDEFVDIIPYISCPSAVTSHFSYIDQPNKWGNYGRNIVSKFKRYKPNIFCLSQSIKETYLQKASLDYEKLYITPNGVNLENFKREPFPLYKDRSLYLAKIDHRKRQTLVQDINGIYFAGNIVNSKFKVNERYLGEWSKKELYFSLTKYANLILLSDGEAHPLVCMEALAAGLGLVISEKASANLDASKRFIDVIPEKKINDKEYIKKTILKNRKYSSKNRKEIFDYAKSFEWSNILKKYYLPAIKRISADFIPQTNNYSSNWKFYSSNVERIKRLF